VNPRLPGRFMLALVTRFFDVAIVTVIFSVLT
jgi:hypothetical protein